MLHFVLMHMCVAVHGYVKAGRLQSLLVVYMLLGVTAADVCSVDGGCQKESSRAVLEAAAQLSDVNNICRF